MTIEQIYEPRLKEKAVRKILEALPEWFALEEGREHYITDSAGQICIVAAACRIFMFKGDGKGYARAGSNGSFKGISPAGHRKKNV